MKKLIGNTILFLLFTIILYLVLLFTWGRYAPPILKPNINYRIGSYGHMHSRLAEIHNYKNIDILFLGSSHAYRGFDTRIFSENGFLTFNLGSSSQTPIQTNILLNRYLSDLNPKTIIYEVYPENFITDGVESSLDIIANDKNDIYSFKMALTLNNIKTYNTYVYGLLNDFLNLNDSYVEPVSKGDDKYIPGGFVEKQIGFYTPSLTEKTEIKINPQQLDSFEKIVQLLKRKNIELILVYAPIPKVTYDSYINHHYFDNLMNQYAPYYDFNKITALNDSVHFQDSNHLNQLGVVTFNKKLINTIFKTRKGSLPISNRQNPPLQP